jgi:uncharacterized protein (DUF4415 family)
MKKKTPSAGSSPRAKRTRVSASDIREYVKTPAFEEDAQRSKAFGAEPSEQDLRDVPLLTEEQWQAMGRTPKVQLTIRLDADVLDWLKEQTGPYQTRINRILRHYMSAAQGRP